MVHEIPYDDPERLRARLRSRYPVTVDRVLGAGRLPNTRLQRGLARMPGVGVLNRFLAWTHWLWFFEPYVALAVALARDSERFPRAARQMAAVFDIGCAVYFAVPTAPPWWAAENGVTDGEPVRRIMPSTRSSVAIARSNSSRSRARPSARLVCSAARIACLA